MIRGLILFLFLLAGLAAAVLSESRMHHLRLAIPDRLPGWSDSVAPGAGLRQGTLMLPARGRWPETTLAWTARLPSTEGWVWHVALAGDGVDLAGQVTLSWSADSATLSGGAGSLDLGALMQAPLPVQGIARVDELEGRVAGLRSGPVAAGALGGRLPALRIDGADFGGGPVTAVLDADGAWRADLQLDGGVTEVEAEIAGTLDAQGARLDAAIADGTALPPRMRALLAAVATPKGPGWRLSATVPVP